jgi:phenylalanine ammonia-lyase
MLENQLIDPHIQNTLSQNLLVVNGESLTIEDVAQVAYQQRIVCLSDDVSVRQRIQASCDYISRAVANSEPIYGVTTGFGGMADIVISSEDAAELQNNAIWLHKTGAGGYLPLADVRAAILLRLNSHARGLSGIRLELLKRMEIFLNANVIPYIPQFGSIGASGDLVPLTYIAGALIGLDAGFTVNYDGEDMDALSALQRLDLPPLRLLPKEGLAMINGTSVMTAIAANCLYHTQTLFAIAMGVHAICIQALRGTNQSFHPFIHQNKPHTGQLWTASHMLELLAGSKLIRNELDGRHDHREQDLIQDRYSLRCLPQFLGPTADALLEITRQIEVEMNSANDNPLIDSEHQASYHSGNFLGQYVGVSMDRLRYHIGLMAKHLDVQISLLVTPQFSNGLSSSLVGNTSRNINMGLKGLQLAGNSIMPLLTFLGNSLVDRFPTHAEQFNQNVNSQGFGSANLARQSVETMQQYIAIALLFSVQAADLRTHLATNNYDARTALSPATVQLYQAVRDVIGKPPQSNRPYIWNDNEQLLDVHIAQVAVDIATGGRIPQAVQATLADFKRG